MIREYLNETKEICDLLDEKEIEKTIEILKELKGRLFILGVGGSAANASHAVNDFRKIAGIEAYAPTDNVAELTARINDDGWENSYADWLKASNIGQDDAILILSVGGGSENTSRNLVEAMFLANSVDAQILGIVSRNGGMTAQMADSMILIPTVHEERITPHAEGFQAIIFHLIVNSLK